MAARATAKNLNFLMSEIAKQGDKIKNFCLILIIVFTFAADLLGHEMKLVFATGNSGKLREASEILGGRIEIVSSAQVGITEDIPETGNTLKENSIQKADYVWNRCGQNCFADDTGLEIDLLGGAPGVYTARYAGKAHDFEANIDKVLSEMAAEEKEASLASLAGLELKGIGRTARFRCVVTLLLDGQKHFFEGVLEGRIALERSGRGGFGYDPVFIPDEFPDKTLADISEEEKNAISHRGKALRAMAQWLDEHPELLGRPEVEPDSRKALLDKDFI